MKFISNRILNPVGESKSFSDYIESLLQTKTASQEAKPGTGIDNTGEPKERGQVINTEGEKEMTNDPQLPTDDKAKGKSEGKKEDKKEEKKEEKKEDKKEEKKESASKTNKTVKADCGKCMGDSADAGKVTETSTEAGPGDSENPEPKVLINTNTQNKPQKPKGKSDKKSSLKSRFQKIASMDRLNKLVLFASLSSTKEYPINYVEAMTGLKFANMTEEEKSWMKDYWKTLYPPEYVEEMVKDR